MTSLNTWKLKFGQHFNGETAWKLVVRVPGYRSGGSGSTAGPTRFSEK
jgi:hypothetical protein